jgi:outer membrane receptor protein involved in Fe transport
MKRCSASGRSKRPPSCRDNSCNSYHDSYRQHNLRVQAQARAVTGPLAHVAALGYAENRSSLHFSGVQNIGGFALDVAAPDFSLVDVNALPTTRRYNDETQRDVSWWLADRISFTAGAWPTHLTLGVRHLRYAIDGDRTGAGRVPVGGEAGMAGHVGLSTELSSDVQAYLAWSSGLEPNRGKTSVGDFLPAQQSRQWEVGTHWRAAPLIRLHLAAYRVDLLNLPMTDPLDRTASISAGQRRVHGAEASFDVTWTAWQLQANLNVQRTRQRVKTTASLGDSFVGVPRASAGLQVAHDFGVSAGLPLRAWAAATALGPRFADAQNTVRVAGYARFDAGLAYLIATGRSLSAGARNLGNRRYVEAVTALDDVYQGPLRQIWLTFSLAL